MNHLEDRVRLLEEQLRQVQASLLLAEKTIALLLTPLTQTVPAPVYPIRQESVYPVWQEPHYFPPTRPPWRSPPLPSGEITCESKS